LSAKIFTSEAGRERLEAGYRRFLAKIPGPVERREVPTAHGLSHVLIAGTAGKPTLVALHGSLASSAHLVSEMVALLDRFRVIAPDLPGQSVRGPQLRLSFKDDSLARWLMEVLGKLGVEEFDLFGVSWGAFAARQTALLVPNRVRKLVLLVPSGVVTGPLIKGLTRMAFPLVMYRLFPSERRKRKFFTPLFTTWDDDWANYTGDAFRDFNLDLRIPPLATDDQLRTLAMPVLVIAAEEDISFPGAKIIERVTRLVPRVETELLAGSKHSPPTTPEFRAWLADRMTRFLLAPGA
jgi:pimeloyl-ACP methyl ester carboxylesterase